MSDDEEATTDELLREILWLRARARRTLRWVQPNFFGRYGAVAAVVDDHDPDTPTHRPKVPSGS